MPAFGLCIPKCYSNLCYYTEHPTAAAVALFKVVPRKGSTAQSNQKDELQNRIFCDMREEAGETEWEGRKLSKWLSLS